MTTVVSARIISGSPHGGGRPRPGRGRPDWRWPATLRSRRQVHGLQGGRVELRLPLHGRQAPGVVRKQERLDTHRSALRQDGRRVEHDDSVVYVSSDRHKHLQAGFYRLRLFYRRAGPRSEREKARERASNDAAASAHPLLTAGERGSVSLFHSLSRTPPAIDSVKRVETN